MRDKAKIASTCSENSDIIEEFIIFVQENRSRIKPPANDDEETPMISPTQTKKKNVESVLMAYNDNQSPVSRGTMLGASTLEKYMGEQDDQPIVVPVSCILSAICQTQPPCGLTALHVSILHTSISLIKYQPVY
jgi:hypothetical protein